MAGDKKPALPEGVYALSDDVRNLDGDGRSKSDWRKLYLWPKGTRFIVRHETIGNPGNEIVYAMLSRTGGLYSPGVAETDLVFKRIAPLLVPVPRTVDTLLLLYNADGILKRLLSDGKITLDDIESAAKPKNNKEF